MGRIADEMLRDINKETVDFPPNYDDSDEEPLVLPAAFPYLLANGASPESQWVWRQISRRTTLREIADGVAAMLENDEITVDGLATRKRSRISPPAGRSTARGIKQRLPYRQGPSFLSARVLSRGEQTRPRRHRRSRDTLHGQQGDPHHADRRSGARPQDRRNRRSPGRVGPQRHADRDRAQKSEPTSR